MSRSRPSSPALPRDGLIVDIRANPGGSIPAAEAVLQLLSSGPISPVSVSLSTTEAALALCDANRASRHGPNRSASPWKPADGLPRYRGPKVLITDALSYSAADVFAAGFQDNQLGPTLSTAGLTGAGGANVWTQELLRMWLPDMLDAPRRRRLPHRVRRVTCAGARVGVPLEDLDVTPTTSITRPAATSPNATRTWSQPPLGCSHRRDGWAESGVTVAVVAGQRVFAGALRCPVACSKA